MSPPWGVSGVDVLLRRRSLSLQRSRVVGLPLVCPFDSANNYFDDDDVAGKAPLMMLRHREGPLSEWGAHCAGPSRARACMTDGRDGHVRWCARSLTGWVGGWPPSRSRSLHRRVPPLSLSVEMWSTEHICALSSSRSFSLRFPRSSPSRDTAHSARRSPPHRKNEPSMTSTRHSTRTCETAPAALASAPSASAASIVSHSTPEKKSFSATGGNGR